MLPALTLAFCLTVASQGSSSVPNATTPARQDQATSASSQEGSGAPSQQKKHARVAPTAERSSPQQPPPATTEDKSSPVGDVTPHLLDRWFQAYVLITGLMVL